MLDLRIAREAYDHSEIDNLALIVSHTTVADALTKPSPNNAMMQLLCTGKLQYSIRQYVVEKRARKGRGV